MGQTVRESEKHSGPFSDQKVRVTPAEEDIILWSDTGPGIGVWDTGFILTTRLVVLMASLGPNVHLGLGGSHGLETMSVSCF